MSNDSVKTLEGLLNYIERVSEFEALTSGDPKFRLMPCYVNGEAALAIVSVSKLDEERVTLEPLYVSVTKGMVLEDQNHLTPATREEVERPILL